MSVLDLQHEIRMLREEIVFLRRQVQELMTSKSHTYGPMKITDWPSPQERYTPFPDIWCKLDTDDVERIKMTLSSEPSAKAMEFYEKIFSKEIK